MLERLGDVLHRRLGQRAVLQRRQLAGRRVCRARPSPDSITRVSRKRPSDCSRAVWFMPVEKPVYCRFGPNRPQKAARGSRRSPRPGRAASASLAQPRSPPGARSSARGEPLDLERARAPPPRRARSRLVAEERRPEQADDAVADHLVEHAAVRSENAHRLFAPVVDELADALGALEHLLADAGEAVDVGEENADLFVARRQVALLVVGVAAAARRSPRAEKNCER